MQDGSYGDKGEERSRQLVVTGGNAAMFFDRAEEVFDPVTLAVEAAMKGATFEPRSVQRETRKDLLHMEQGAQAIGVIALVSNESSATAFLQVAHQLGRLSDVHNVAPAQKQFERTPFAIDQRVNLRGQPATTWPQVPVALGRRPDWRHSDLPARKSNQ